MHNRRLSRQDTLLASDPIWRKPLCVDPGFLTPILPRNAPSIEDNIDSTPRSTPRSLPKTHHAEVDVQIMLDVPTSVAPELDLQVSVSVHFAVIFPLMCFAVSSIVSSGYPSCQ
jgi:hypothetical protein